VDISDYQALTRLFPVDHKPLISEEKRFQLWDLEGSGTTSVASLTNILNDFPVRIDYVVVLGDSPTLEPGKLVGVNPGDPFVRVYRR
jgi:hypothetical protein